MPSNEIQIPVSRFHFATQAEGEAAIEGMSGGYKRFWYFDEADDYLGVYRDDSTWRYLSPSKLFRPGASVNAVLQSDANGFIGVNTAPNVNLLTGIESLIEFNNTRGNTSIYADGDAFVFLTNAYEAGIGYTQVAAGANPWRMMFTSDDFRISYSADNGAGGATSFEDILFGEGSTGNWGINTIKPFVDVVTNTGDFDGRGLHVRATGTNWARIILETELAGTPQLILANLNDQGANTYLNAIQSFSQGFAFVSLNDDTTTKNADILKMNISGRGNILIGTATVDGTADTCLAIKEGIAPGALTADQIYIWAQDDGGTAEAYVQDGAGNQTKFSPHNKDGEWEYYSKNVKTGKTVRINMEKLCAFIDNQYGTNFLETK